MPRSRGSDSTGPPHQRASPRAPLHLRAAAANTADSNASPAAVAGVHHANGRPIRDRSPKLEEHRRSPRSPLPEVGVCTTAQKKRATRVADLETRLSHAQDELRKLREQLASAEAAKKDAQQELQETKKKKKKGTTTANTTATTAKKNAAGDLDDQTGDKEKECPLALPSEEKIRDKDDDGGDENNNEKKPPRQETDEEDRGDGLKVAAANADVGEERAKEPTAPAEVVEVEGGGGGGGGCGDNSKEEEADSNHSHPPDVTADDDGPPKEEEEHSMEQPGRGVTNVEELSNPVVEGEQQEMPAATTETTSSTNNSPINNIAAAAVTTTTEPDEQVPKPPSPAAAEEEMLEVETRLWKKDKDLDLLRSENTSLKSQLTESESTAAALAAKVASLESSLEDQRRAADAKISETEAARAALEVEVRRLRVQTEQWRKAADAAAAIISGEDFDGGALGGRKVAERCGSMDKYIGGGGSAGGLGFDAAAVLGSPLLAEGAEADGAAAGKRRGIRVFGDLWRKKGQIGGANK